MTTPHFTELTTNYWQDILPPAKKFPAPWQYGYPTILPDFRILILPIRQISDKEAVASLILNQASIQVANELAAFLAEVVQRFQPDVIIGLPTLGLTLAMNVAHILGLGEQFI